MNIIWIIIQIQLGNKELLPGHTFLLNVLCGLDLEDMTLGQGHGTSFDHGQ